MSEKPNTNAFLLQKSAKEREMRVPESWSGGSDYSEIEVSGPEATIEVGGTLNVAPEQNIEVFTVNQTTAPSNQTTVEASEQSEVYDNTEPEEDEPRIEANVSENINTGPNHPHQPLRAMGNLSAERFSIEIEDQGNEPWDGSHKHLRNLSPFTIALLPPEDIAAPSGSGNPDPYSWDRFSKLVSELPKLKASDKIADKATRTGDIDTAISNLQMFVSEGKITPELAVMINGTNRFNVTPFFGLANVADVYIQLLNMFKTPPLILLVNPNSMSVNYNKIQNYSERTRYGYIFQAWGEELPTLNFSGRIGAYVGGESAQEKRGSYSDKIIKNQETTHVSGVQEVSRRVSPAYQNLMQLLLLYKNNAYIRDNVGKSQANHMIGMVEISYDGVRYQGHFDKLEWTFEENNNLGGVNFSFDFTATRIIHTDERNSIPMKQRNPNTSSRFGGDRSERGRPGAMRDFMTRLASNSDGSILGNAGISIEQNLVTINEDGEAEASSAVRSWRNQAAQTVVGQSIAIGNDREGYDEGEYEVQDSSGIVRTRNYTPEDF